MSGSGRFSPLNIKQILWDISGVLLCYVGIQHALFLRDILEDRAALSVALTTALAGFMTGNLTIGFLAGFGIHYALMGFDKTMKFLEEH